MRVGIAPTVALILLGVLAGGCGTTPSETVELSEIVGQDLQTLQTSNRALIRSYFDGLRAQVNNFIDDEWAPVFLREFIDEGRLIDRAKQSNPDHVLEDVGDWVKKAIERIERRRAGMLAPIQDAEEELMIATDAAFGRAVRANSAITAQLRSRAKLDEEQDRILEEYKLKDLRDDLEQGMLKASKQTDDLIGAVRKADGLLDKVPENAPAGSVN